MTHTQVSGIVSVSHILNQGVQGKVDLCQVKKLALWL